MTDIEKLTKDTVQKGGVLTILYFDLHAKESDNLTHLATSFIDTILKQEGVVTAYGEIEEPMEQNGTYSTTIELKVLTKDFETLVNICSLFSPLNVEIQRPNEIKLSLDKAHALLVSVAANWFNIKKYIAERVSTKEELEQFTKYVQDRAAMGKKMLDEKRVK